MHKDYRNGIILTLLWPGLVEYSKSINAKYLFGCSSVNTTNFLEAALIYKYMIDSGVVDEKYGVQPTDSYKICGFQENLNIINQLGINSEYAEKIVPPLLKSYIKAGAVICGEPAYDSDFQCMDFSTLLDTEFINDNYSKKFGGNGKIN